LLLKCAVWTADVIDQFQFKPLPLKTQDIREHEAIPEEDRVQLSNEYYNSKPHIRAFFKLHAQVVNENKSSYDWLKECKTRLLENGMKDKADIIDLKLKEVTVEMLK